MLRLAAAITLALSSTAALAAPRGLQVEDLVTLARVSDPRLSPDGRHALYVLRETDLEKNKGVTAIWLQPVDGGAARRLTASGSSANTPRWSPDGKSVYFLSTRSGSQQLWRLDLTGGEARQITDYPVDVGSYRLSPDGRAVALSLEVFPDCADLACTKQRMDERAADKSSAMLFDKLFIRHWDAWKDGRRNQLFVARFGEDGRTGEPTKISRGIDGDVHSKPFGDAAEYTFTPDGQSIVFSARIAGRSEPWSTNFDLFQVSVDGNEAPRNLTADNPAWDTGPVFSRDGKVLYYRAMKRPGFEADRFALMRLDLASGERREIAPAWDRSADTIVLSDDGKRIYTLADDLGQHPLFSIDIASGKAQRVVGDGTIGGFDVKGDRLAFVRSRLTAPGELFSARADGGQVKQLSAFNAERLNEVRMGEATQFIFKGWNDETVYGYVVKPWNFEPGKKYPTAFIIHGGPQGSMGDNFHYRWNPQTYAGQGWAVVFIDFHGSTGYGQAFTDSISGDWGGKPLEDLQKGWAAAQQQFDFIDGQRACALGASYGGFMVNWIAGQWSDPWRCLVSHSGVFDARMMGYATEELWFDEWERKGTPWDNPENYEKNNPVNHTLRWNKPMLIIHGQLDYRIPVEQSIGAFTVLQRRGIDSQFLYFPDENHWILKPANSLRWHHTVNAWLHKHLGQ